MIECHYGHCPYHSIHAGIDEGPFCYERECAVKDGIWRVVYGDDRIEYLIDHNEARRNHPDGIESMKQIDISEVPGDADIY